MIKDIGKVINDVSRIFEGAKLEVLSPRLFVLGRELGVLSVVLHSIGNHPEIKKRVMRTVGIKSIIEQAEFVLRKIAADKAFSRLLHDRTCVENNYINAFLPEAKGSRASNIVADITAAAMELAELTSSLYPPLSPAEAVFPGRMVVRPDKERFAAVTRDLAALKKNLP